MVKVTTDVRSEKGYYPECRYGAFRHLMRFDYLMVNLLDPQKIFTEDNTFSGLALIDETDGAAFWIKPCPVLSTVWISEDSRYVVGLSNKLLSNPYQLVVFDIDGDVLHAEAISARVAKFSGQDWKEFCADLGLAEEEFPGLFIRSEEDSVYLSTGSLSARFSSSEEGERVWDLESRKVPHPYSPGFSQVATEVTWYDEESPRIAILEEGEKAYLQVADPQGTLMKIPLQNRAPKEG